MSARQYTEEEIQDLTDRVFLLKERLEAGKIHFAEHLVEGFKRSWGAIRLRQDGLVYPETVDSRIRASTLAILAMKQREEAKKAINLSQIQDTYFSFLFRELGWLYEKMVKEDATPSQVARVFARDPKFVERTMSAFPAMEEALKEFWLAVGDAGAFHLQDGQQLKATFAGDLFPAHWENVVSTAGLYIDTIVLPCPIMRIAPLRKIASDRQFISLFVKHTLTAMSYRDVATADVEPPIALILPNVDDVDLSSRNSLVERAVPAMRKHAAYLFGRDFDSLEHLKDFCDSLTTVDETLAELKGSDRLLFETEWNRNPRTQLTRAMTEVEVPLAVQGSNKAIAGHHIFNACLGRMPQALAAQDNALHFGGTPMINAETSWLHYTWLLEYEAAHPPIGDFHGQSMHVARALVAESQNNLAWLGNVPTNTVLEIRRRGFASEIRELLGKGVAELIGINPGNYFRTADQVVENLDRAFREHQKTLLDAKRKKLKLYGFDIGTFIVTGTLAVTAALTGNPKLGAVSGLLGIAGLPNLKDIKSNFSKIVGEDRARRESPTGLLFRHVTKGP